MAEKACYFIAMLVWMLSGAYQLYDTILAEDCEGKRMPIAYDCWCSFRNVHVSGGLDHVNKGICVRVQLKA